MKNKITNYFQGTRSYSIPRFIIEMSILTFTLKIVAIILASPFLTLLGFDTASNLDLEKSFLDYELWQAVVLIIIFAAFETVTSQMFILWLSKKISKDLAFRLFFSAVIFAVLHLEPMLVVAVFPIGLILAWSYLIYREKSVWHALSVTTAIHVIHNLFALWLVSLG